MGTDSQISLDAWRKQNGFSDAVYFEPSNGFIGSSSDDERDDNFARIRAGFDEFRAKGRGVVYVVTDYLGQLLSWGTDLEIMKDTASLHSCWKKREFGNLPEAAVRLRSVKL
jgi:hypothetical protein